MRAFGTRRVLLLRDLFRAWLVRIRRENDGGCPTDSVNTLNLEPCAVSRSWMWDESDVKAKWRSGDGKKPSDGGKRHHDFRGLVRAPFEKFSSMTHQKRLFTDLLRPSPCALSAEP